MKDEFLTYKFLDLHFCYDKRDFIIKKTDGISENDIKIIRKLAKRIAHIAALPEQQSSITRWTEMNDLVLGNPLINMEEVCWHEFSTEEDLKIQTTHPLCQRLEAELRQTLYRWDYMRGDMVVTDTIYSPIAIYNSGVGMEKEAEVLQRDAGNDVVSHKYKMQLQNEDDIDKFQTPEIFIDAELTDKTFQIYQQIFDGILQVEKRGAPGFLMAAMWIASLYLYGFGAEEMGELGVKIGWPIFISLSIIVGNLLGLLSGEWKSASKKLLFVGIALLIVSILIISLSK